MKNKIVYINVVCNGSTGKIMCDTATKALKENYQVYCFYGRGVGNPNLNTIKIGNKLSTLFHAFIARFGFNGHGSYFATKKLIKRIKKFDPDIIHLHNIHGYYINIKLLFDYLKNQYKGKIVWMLHDCWSFTGHCSHFSLVNCPKWKKQCCNCPQLNTYPKTFIDTTKREYNLKKRIFSDINNMTLITPSNWLENLVKKSYLKKYQIRTIHNGINLNIFRPMFDDNIYIKYNIPKYKKILLGVSNVWDSQKGLNILLELSSLLNKDELIVLVGLNDEQLKQLPKNIIGIKKTDNQEELAKLYSLADVFINPSYEETFSLVTIEALACGTPVVVCGMSAVKEIVNEKVGIVVHNYTSEEYYKAYKEVIKQKIPKETLLEHAKIFSNEIMTEKNIELYKEL